MTTLIVEDEMAPVPDWVWLMALAEKHNITAFPEDLEQFVRELIAVEREACAKLCEELRFSELGPSPAAKHQRDLCAAAIRARSNK